MRFCFIILLAGFLHAGDAPPQAGRIVSVVRADPRTGRLVRSVMLTPGMAHQRYKAATPEAHPAAMQAAVKQAAARHALPAELLDSVIRVESNYNSHAVSPKGALGLMQLVPETARRFGVGDVFDPLENLEGGARYLRYLLDLYGGDYPLTLAAYNAGEGAVARYRGVPPYPETQSYVLQVKRKLDQAAGLQRAETPAPRPASPDGPAHIEPIVETDGTVRYVSRR